MKYLKEKDFILSSISCAIENYCNKDGFITEQKGAYDLVTDIDKGIEDFLKKEIYKEFPEDNIISEETLPFSEINGRTWIIDPIDGTCNMAHGINFYGVQCALIEGEDIVLSAIVLPAFGEEYYAIKDGGAYLNGKRISVSSKTSVQNSIVSFGDYSHKSSKHAILQHKAIGWLYPQIAKIRMFGAACFDFTFLASGKTDSTVIMTKNLWDICPGVLLCKEAGAIVTDFDGKDYKAGVFGVAASSNENLHNLTLASLKE